MRKITPVIILNSARANNIKPNMTMITPRIIFSAADVAVFGSWTVVGVAVTVGTGRFSAAT